MRLISLSICSLLWLTFLSSTFYFYLILKQFANSPTYRAQKNYLQSIFQYRSSPNTVDRDRQYEREIFRQQNETFHLYEKHLQRMRSEILAQLSRWELNGASPLNRLHRLNPYEVAYGGPKGRSRATRASICSNPIKLYPRDAFIHKKFSPKMRNDEMTFNPEMSINLEDVIERFHYPKSCALVSSAASIFGSGSGSGIDNHEIVLRFNGAPAGGQWKDDVGSHTHVRIVNSQLIENDTLLHDPAPFSQVINIVWDVGHYRDSPTEWYERRKGFFLKYNGLLKKRASLQLYLLDSRFAWDCWDMIQTTRRLTMIRNPVSSGFLGAVLLTQVCEEVTLFEYLPSSRASVKCHYYDNTTGSGCTMGDWHPLASEKLFMADINENDNWGTYEGGQVRISGCRSV